MSEGLQRNQCHELENEGEHSKHDNVESHALVFKAQVAKRIALLQSDTLDVQPFVLIQNVALIGVLEGTDVLDSRGHWRHLLGVRQES